MRLCDYFDENVVLTYHNEEYVAFNFFRYVNDRILVVCKKENYNDDEVEPFFITVEEDESGNDVLSFVEGEFHNDLLDVLTEIYQFLMSTGAREIPVFRAQFKEQGEDEEWTEILVVLKTFIIDNKKFNLCALGSEIDISFLFEVSDFERTDDDPEFDKDWKLIEE